MCIDTCDDRIEGGISDMKFTGLQPFGYMTGQIDFVLDSEGVVDLRNQAHIVGIRFIPNKTAMSIVYDFSFDSAQDDRLISLEFIKVEVIELAHYLESGVDPGYGYALLFGIDHWRDTGDEFPEKEGFAVDCTVMKTSFYAEELTATISKR
jgi:hypothetical protein